MNTATCTTANVDIWIGSEWAPIREAFAAYLAGIWATSPDRSTVVASSLNPETPTGRVTGWIQRACSAPGGIAAAYQPGDGFDIRSVLARPLIGVTELLLDPDPGQVDQFYALGIWSRFVPRRKRLLMRVTPFLTEEIVDNAARADPALIVQVAEWQGQRVLLASTDPIAAEVTGRAFRSTAQPAGDIGLNPWQTDLVRIASERSLGATSGPRMMLAVRRAGPMPPPVAAAFHALAERVSGLVDCAVSFEGLVE